MLKNNIQSSYYLVVQDIVLSLWTKACVVTIQVGIFSTNLLRAGYKLLVCTFENLEFGISLAV